MLVDRIRQRTQEWFDEARKKWNSIMQEAIYTDRNFESFFGDAMLLNISIAKAKKAEAEAQEELLGYTKRIYDVNNPQPLWDPYRGHYYERIPEQTQEALKVPGKEEDSRKLNLISRVKWLEKCQAKPRMFEIAQKARVAYFGELMKCWNRIQQRQLAEYEDLDMDCEDLIPKPFGLDGKPVTPKEQTVEAQEAADKVPHQGTGLTQEAKTLEGQWKVEAPQWEQAQKAQVKGVHWRSQLGGRGVDPTQMSARRWPPTDRPPDKPPPWKGAIVGSLHERAGSPYFSQLASSFNGIRSLCGSYRLLTPAEQSVRS
jgi:hypothetical protein